MTTDARFEDSSPSQAEQRPKYHPPRISTIAKVGSVTHGSRDKVDDSGSGYQNSNY
jgi:hypothetical protein